MFQLFKKTRELENKIDAFLDTILQASLEYREGMKYYLSGQMEDFEKRVQEVDRLEGKADTLRREIENTIYAEMLLPEARGDVLALLENSDDVLNALADSLVEFSVERPEILPEHQEDWQNLVEVSLKAVEEMVAAVRAYFKDIAAVKNHIAGIMFYEKESDKVGEKLKRQIFGRTDLRLSHKMHLRSFVAFIQDLADRAEDVGDRLSIYVIKRLV